MIKLNLPGSKSITNRDFVLASLCEGECRIKGYLESDDTIYMIKALRDLGIYIQENVDELIINGGLQKLNGGDKEIYIHQSGTCMRFLTGLSILNKSGFIKLTGDHRLLERPMGDLINGIKDMGVKIDSNGNLPPVKIFPSNITNNKISISGESSSQFFTSLLQIGSFIKGGLVINVIGEMVSKPYIDLSIEELRKFGIKVENNNYKKFVIKEQQIKNPGFLQIEGDASALSYIANLSVLENKHIEISNIGIYTKQGDYKYLEVLKKFFGLIYNSNETNTILDGQNAHFDLSDERIVDFEEMPDVSMSFMSLSPLLFGKTIIKGLQTLNLKECNRIDVMGNELRKLGVKLEFDYKSMTIYNGFNPPKEVDIETYNDHRIAMVFGVLKIYLEKKFDTKINILNPNCVSKTYPNFWEDIKILNDN